MPDFSIITVCYNSAATVADTLRSVLEQTGVSVQHIVKDAGSTDETVSIATRVNPAAVIEVSRDCGVYDGMNQGFALATGEIVGFLNSDDYYADPTVLQSVRDKFAATSCDVLYGDIAMINAAGQVVRSWTSGEISPGSLNGKQLPHPALFVRRLALTRLGLPFDPSYRISADYKQQLLLVEKAGLPTAYLARTITIMRTGGESTRNLKVVVRGWVECARAYHEVHNRSGWLMVARKVMSKVGQVQARLLTQPNRRPEPRSPDIGRSRGMKLEVAMSQATAVQDLRRQIAVIGGSGFIGTRLCARLKDHHDLSIIDKRISADFPGLTRQADVRDLAALRGALAEGAIVVNLAAEHRDDVTPRSLYDEVNVQGARNLCQVAREKSIHTIVFTSTVAVYGFAPIGTDESGKIAPFADYGRTKFEAETVFRAWQAEDPAQRRLVIVRPTVVFGERNRGNVYNLFRQIAAGMFVMVGPGTNRKSIAYVGNVVAFLEQCLLGGAGVWTYNYIDKPDLDMNALVSVVRRTLGKPETGRVRLPTAVALGLGHLFDLAAKVSGRKFAISAIRVKKFTSNSVFGTAITPALFTPPVSLDDAIARTITSEFVDRNSAQTTFDSE